MKSLADVAADLRLFAKYHLVRRAFDHPAREEELGVHLLGYEPEAYARELASLGDRFDVEELATVGYCGGRYPIHLVHTKRPAAERRLLVLAGVHGNEQAGILAIPRILRAVDEQGIAPNVELRVVTPVNAVGAAVGSRYNADGFDINRDFQRFETVEAQVVREVFDARRPDLVLSLHEGPQEATFLFANRKVEEAVALRFLQRLQGAEVALADIDYFGRELERPGYAPMTPGMWRLNELWADTLGMMATGVWADRLGVPEITIESSWRGTDADQRIRAHEELVLGALAELT